MKPTPTQSLRARFRSAVLTVSVAILSSVTVLVYLSAKSHYLETGEASARASVAAVQQTLSVGVYARDDILLKELVEGLARHPSVARVGVTDLKGATLASAASPDQPDAGSTVPETASFQTTLVSPFANKEAVGRLDVWLDTRRLAIDAHRQAGLVVAALFVLLAGVLVSFNELAERLLSRPMHRLAADLAAIVPGTVRRLPLAVRHERDEVGVVTRAANRLLDLQQSALERERAMREEISALEARYRGIFDSTSAGIFILSADGRLLQANPALSRLLGMPVATSDAVDVPDFAVTAFVSPPQLARLVDRTRETLQPEAGDLELIRVDGRTAWVHCMVSLSVDVATGEECIEGVLYNITQRKLLERAAQHRAEHDALTGLKNRAFIETELHDQIQLAQSSGTAVTLMFIDLDGFKAVNDRWGHAAGDAVLVEAADRLRSLFKRSCDQIGRLGGDELVVLIVGVAASHPSVAEQAGRLLQNFRSPFVLPNGDSARVGASIGVASHPLHATHAKKLIHAADAAMYAVKQAGKGGFAIAETVVTPEDAASAERPAMSDAMPVEAQDHQVDPLTGLMDRRQLVDRLAMEQARVENGAEPVGVICIDIDQFNAINMAHGLQVGDAVLCETARRLTSGLRHGDVIARVGGNEFIAVVSIGIGSECPRLAVDRIARKLLDGLGEPFLADDVPVTIRAGAGFSLIGMDHADGLAAMRESQLAMRQSKASGSAEPVFYEADAEPDTEDRRTTKKTADRRSSIATITDA